MPQLWVPPSVTREMRNESLRIQAEGLNATIKQDSQIVKELDKALDGIERGMEMVFCPDPCPVQLTALGGRPGRWGVFVPGRLGGPPSIMALLGEQDEFVEPGWWVVDMVQRSDWQNPRVRRDRAEAERVREVLAEKYRQDERDRADREVLELYLAKTRTQVSMNTDTPWAQNHAGYAKRRGEKKRG